jgi:DNA polymerase-3 subunit delta'
LQGELEPFLDERGRPQEPFRAVVRRLTEQHERRLRRAEREFLDLALMSLTAYFRDVAAIGAGAGTDILINIDLPVADDSSSWASAEAALAMGAVEEARADLADETNLNARLVLERVFLRLAEAGSVSAAPAK